MKLSSIMANLFPGSFLSCDWGTSSFRLRLVSGETGAVRGEIRTPNGVKSIHDSLGGNQDAAGRERAFATCLRSHVETLLNQHGTIASGIALVLSGMASSTIGWRQLPYAAAPFSLDGGNLHVERLSWDAPPQISATWLISGVATATNMMRGEETEIIGLMSDPQMARFRTRSLLMLPGTHSKHVTIRDGMVTGFSTFMTGELFDVLQNHSILKASVHESAPNLDAFREGVEWQRNRSLSEALFRVRTRHVLAGTAPSENHWFLSGLLIGAEIAAATTKRDCPAVIAASQPVTQLYAAAFEAMKIPNENWTVLPPRQVEHASVLGHAQLLNRMDIAP